MSKASLIIYGLLLSAVYVLFTGSYTLLEAVLAVFFGITVAGLFARELIHDPSKISLARFARALEYLILYFTIVEVKAHWSVIKLILNPSAKYKPAIVRVPYELKSDYSVFAVANSITNTPGTVVVDLDEGDKSFYVHWIDASSTIDEEARRMISLDFEKRVSKIFE
ncbi:MAG: Na+/H+ antiporter subunit E [Thermosphaera sp.]